MVKRKNVSLLTKVNQQYYDANLPGSFSARSGFLSHRKFADKKEIDKELGKLKEILLYKPVKKNFRRRKIIVMFNRYQIGADLVETRKYKRENNGICYLLFIIDQFSRYLWVYKLKKKNAQDVTNAFKSFFAENAAGKNRRWILPSAHGFRIQFGSPDPGIGGAKRWIIRAGFLGQPKDDFC